MPSRLRALAAALWGAVALGAWAQETTLGTSDAVQCLGPADVLAAGPEYEFELWKGEKAGRVVVEAEFTGPDLAPAIKVLRSEGDPAFVASVRRHVALWRVPCMSAGAAPVRLSREYVFRPLSQRPSQGEVKDAADALRADLLTCMRHAAGVARPVYPREARLTGLQGRVAARVRFTSPDRAPEVKLFARDSARPLRDAVGRWLDDVRLPCLTGEAVNSTMVFVFRMEGDGAFGFQPLTLVQFLGAAKGREHLRLQADTRTMGCPFEVWLQYLQPQAPNRAYTPDGDRAEREPLLNVLRGIELRLGERYLDAIFADSTLITVPCATIDLKPQGETP